MRAVQDGTGASLTGPPPLHSPLCLIGPPLPAAACCCSNGAQVAGGGAAGKLQQAAAALPPSSGTADPGQSAVAILRWVLAHSSL